MYQIEIYKDAKGNSPVRDFIKELNIKGRTSKTDHIRAEKIAFYMEHLKSSGTRIGEPITKHLDAEIWEIRPYDDRILYAGLKDGKFILIHHFIKKSDKTPRREIEKAKRNLEDYLKRTKEQENNG